LFIDRFFILRNLKKFYFKLREDFYHSYLYHKGIAFKNLKARTEDADPQDKEVPMDKSKKNTVIIDNKKRNNIVYYKKGQIFIENKNKSDSFSITEDQNFSKNKILLDTSNKNIIRIDNNSKDKRVTYDKNNIVITITDKKKFKYRDNALEQPVALVLQKPLFGFFINSIIKTNTSFINFAFLSQEFKRLF
jgi:hypothetical protein